MIRNFSKVLEEYERENIKTPLMILGARQIGKTYTINEFCKARYENYIYINFEDMPLICDIFEKSLKPEDIIKNIEIELGKNIDPKNTVIFFDEVQLCSKAITSLKYFCESDTNYRIICAGSLLGVKLKRFDGSFPVGKVRIVNMYPMDFEEFLVAVGEELLSKEIQRCFDEKKPMLDIFHQKALKYYTDYLYVGGMPAAVNSYIQNNNDVMKLDRVIHKSIISSYIADMTKHTMNSSETLKINAVYESIPKQLAKENAKFKYSLVTVYANKRDFELPIDWLISSSIVYKAINLKRPMAPLKVYEEDSNFKIYLSDVGLLNTMMSTDYKEIMQSENNIIKGGITENYVAMQFKSKDIDLNYYKPNQYFEIDFILKIDGDIIPVEVKSGTNTKGFSLDRYIKEYSPKYGIRISAKNFGYVNDIFSIPLYSVFCVNKYNKI